MRRENAQLREAASDASEAASAANESRTASVQRLQHELQQAVTAAEVNRAKAEVHDELKKHTREVEARNRTLVAAEDARGALQGELAAVQETHKVRHCYCELQTPVHRYPCILFRQREGQTTNCCVISLQP